MSNTHPRIRGSFQKTMDRVAELDSGARQVFEALGMAGVAADIDAADWSAAIHLARNYRLDAETFAAQPRLPASIPMLLWCPACGERHIDRGEFAEKVHRTHACQHCGMVWRPAVVATTGVEFLPGFKSE